MKEVKGTLVSGLVLTLMLSLGALAILAIFGASYVLWKINVWLCVALFIPVCGVCLTLFGTSVAFLDKWEWKETHIVKVKPPKEPIRFETVEVKKKTDGEQFATWWRGDKGVICLRNKDCEVVRITPDGLKRICDAEGLMDKRPVADAKNGDYFMSWSYEPTWCEFWIWTKDGRRIRVPDYAIPTMIKEKEARSFKS